ncbi:MAG: YidC/Oxa1 family membrane protein insertase [Lachnospiraceae bacterium]
MDLLALTKSNTFIIGPVATLLGYIMEGIFEFCNWFGVANIGLSIILFTIIVKLVMLPMAIKQQKFSKLNSVMSPELQAISKKYKGKTDQESMIRQNEETKAVYEKYGTSPTGGCLQLLIQMPILFALYRVIYNIPAYVSSVKNIYDNIVNVLIQIPNYATNQGFIDLASTKAIKAADLGNELRLVDLMYTFNGSDWDKFGSLFNNTALTEAISENLPVINHMNLFLGIDLASPPTAQLWPAVLIPILAGLTQWLSTKLMSTGQTTTDPDAPGANMMKSMNTVMPLMSVFFCFTFASGIGLYWVASSVCQIVIQLFVNKYMDRVDVNDLIQKNLDKVNKKRAKQGLPPKSITKNAVANVKNIKVDPEEEDKKAQEREERIKKATEYYKKTSSQGKSGSLADRASMVQKYNDKHKK